MKPALFAVLTAVCWSAGSFFEKKGLGLAGLSPIMGITIRTAVAMVVLGALSYSHWSSLANIHIKPLLYLVLGGGVLAGALGMFFFYTAIGSGQLSRVMPVAFGLTPLIGFLIGVLAMKEPIDAAKALGVALVCAGVVLITQK